MAGKKRKIRKYDNLRVSSIEWDKLTPFIMVVWRVDVTYNKEEDEDEIIEMVFPLCLS